MMTDIISELDQQINSLKSLQQQLIANVQTQRMQQSRHQIHEPSVFGRQLNEKRKALGIDLQTLELQTGVSVSTLKRLFQDPSQVRFATVLLIAETLGVSLCTL